MSTEQVLADTVRRAQRLRLRVHRLPTTFDVDEAADLRALAGALAAPSPDAAPAPRTLAALQALGLASAR
jgi:hypothetical protein